MRRIAPLLLCLLFALPTAGGADEVQRWDSKLEQKIKEREEKNAYLTNTQPEKDKEKEQTSGPSLEELLSVRTPPINTVYEEWGCYIKDIEGIIELYWENTELAKKEDWKGSPIFSFYIEKGDAVKFETLKSSGSKKLDSLANAALRAAYEYIKNTCARDDNKYYVFAKFDYQDIALRYSNPKNLDPEDDIERIVIIRNKKWSKSMKQTVLEKKITLGMTEDQARLAWGYPHRINESIGLYGRREQWVYENNYVYFVNGKLSSWQTSK